MKTPFGGRAPRRLPRLCSDSVSDSASEVHNTPLCTLQRRTHNLLPFGASTQARTTTAKARRVSRCNYPAKIILLKLNLQIRRSGLTEKSP